MNHIETGIEQVEFSLSQQLADISYSVKQFGALGDWNGNAGTDDTQAIKNAIEFVKNLPNATLNFPMCLGYCTSEKIIFPPNLNIKMDAPIIYTGIENIPAIEVGETGKTSFSTFYQLQTERENQSDWESEDCIGIKIINANTCKIDIVKAKKYTIGVQFVGSNGGFSYNEVYFGYISENKYQVEGNNEKMGGVGWCNENLYSGGRFGVKSGVNPTKSRYGIRITSKDAYYNNNNNFIKPSFELTKPTNPLAEALPILIEYGSKNTFEKIRNEGNTEVTAKIKNDSVMNRIDVGYGTLLVEDTSNYPTTKLSSTQFDFKDSLTNLLFKIDSLEKKTCIYNGTTSLHIPKLLQVSASSGATFKAIDFATIHKNYLEVATHGLARYFKTVNSKRFLIKKDTEKGFSGRVRIVCFDKDGEKLGSATSKKYVKGEISKSLLFYTSFGGHYGTGADTDGDIFFQVEEEVHEIMIIISAGSTPLRVRSLSVYSDDTSSSWVGYEEMENGANLATTPPTQGNWMKGRRIINDNPTIGQPKSWICTVSGTPGTWVSEGNL